MVEYVQDSTTINTGNLHCMARARCRVLHVVPCDWDVAMQVLCLLRHHLGVQLGCGSLFVDLGSGLGQVGLLLVKRCFLSMLMQYSVLYAAAY